MPKYIDAGKLKSRFENALTDFIHKSEIAMIIDNTPAADVEEVKHGEWIENGADYKCSECGKYDSYGLDPYCCNCGARMDGKESE